MAKRYRFVLVMFVDVSRWSQVGVARGDDYDTRWSKLEAAGESIHGEADLVGWFEPECVLDAGCGTGRVAIELDRRGIGVVGVDLDLVMLATARRKAPHIDWFHGDLADVTVTDDEGRRRAFDVVVMAGNVMIFLAPRTEAAVVANMTRHLGPAGRLVAGFQLDRAGPGPATYDRMAAGAGLVLEHRWSTWERDRYADGDYAVSVYRRR